MTGRARHPLLVALQPVADALGAELVEAAAVEPSDIPLEWEGRVVGAMRMPMLQVGLDRLIEGVERELGAPTGRPEP